jgi:hypothetical protein
MLAELVTTYRFRALADEVAYNPTVGDCRRADVRLVEPKANGVERVNVDPLSEARGRRQELRRPFRR